MRLLPQTKATCSDLSNVHPFAIVGLGFLEIAGLLKSVPEGDHGGANLGMGRPQRPFAHLQARPMHTGKARTLAKLLGRQNGGGGIAWRAHRS